MKKWLTKYIEDLLILAGLGLIAWATFRLNTTAGLYNLGIEMVGVGVVLARRPPGRR